MNKRRETKPKPFPITKEQVWEAFQHVKRKGGSKGVDGISIKTVAANPREHLYPVWNRLASGSYFPPPVKRVEIAKGDGKTRPLGIPTVKDRVAQKVIADELSAIAELLFSNNSFGYRPRKSAHQAIAQAKRNCWEYAWVVDMDIKGFFDNIDHELMMQALRYFTDKKHILLYAQRWLEARVTLPDRSLLDIEGKGTPQGGVISPILANIFLHVVLDKWLEKNFPDCPFERYADDVIIHAKDEYQARQLLEQLTQRMQACKLTLHPDKTKLVHCRRVGVRRYKKADHQQFDFLGLTFRPRLVMTKKGRLLLGFSPSISKKAEKKIIEACRNLEFHRWVNKSLEQMVKELNPKIRGWIQYYARHGKSAMEKVFRVINLRLVKWAFNKYKRLKRRKSKYGAIKWFKEIYKYQRTLFYHWTISAFNV